MKRVFILLITIPVFMFTVFEQSYAQTTWDYEERTVDLATGNVTLHSKKVAAQSIDPLEVEKMIHIDYASLFNPETDFSGGIQGKMENGGKATLSVYAFDTNVSSRVGRLIYRVSSSVINEDGFTGVEEVAGEANIKENAQLAQTYILPVGETECANFDVNWMTSLFRSIGGGSGGAWTQCTPYYDPRQPILVQLSLSGKCHVSKIKIPGVGELDVINAFYEQHRGGVELVPQNIILKEDSGIKLSFDLKIYASVPLTITNASVYLENPAREESSHSLTINNITVGPNGIYTLAEFQFLSQAAYNALRAGAYNIIFKCKVAKSTSSTAEVLRIPLTFFRKVATGQLTTYQIRKTDYQGLPVYALRGGMSAEYAVQKSLAALSAGISHTWDVRNKPNGALDITGGGPVSVVSSPHFLKNSIAKTVDLYNTHLGPTTAFNTVIISTGVPAAPYLSYVMGAPVLPLHFLVAANSLAEIESMVHIGIDDGYSCYSTAGYDPSIEGEGVAWIKLLDLPAEYKQFLIDHNVQNVILMGASESGWGEVIAQRIKFKFKVDNPSVYEPGSVYIMKHGGEAGLNNLRSYYSDYEDYPKEQKRAISDWESGIVEEQLTNFRNSIRTIPENPPAVYAMKGSESVAFYNIVMDLALKFWSKNAPVVGTHPIQGISMNEYLIGYPAYESKVGQVPLAYLQLSPRNTAARVKNLLQYKVTTQYPTVNFKGLPVKFNAKWDRSPYIQALKDIGMTTVTQNAWQKADIWDPSDGLDAPCELVAKDIINNQGGAGVFKTWVNSLTKLSMDDIRSMVLYPEELPAHPNPTTTVDVFNLPEAGLAIRRYEFPAHEYWNSRESLKELELFDITSSSSSFIGWIDGVSKTGNDRRQRITISQFDLDHKGSEYDLKIGYKFDPQPEDGFKSYNTALGTQQNMDCFEYTRVPKTSWLDIPSRVMAREGAVLVTNGTVYDWDYNGIPGSVPFIKIDSIIKAQPQILSYKGEAVFAWNWGVNKQVLLSSRPKDIPANGLVSSLKTLFHTETSAYKNVLGGMTFMSGGALYNYESLQPTWMLKYPRFNPRYFEPSATAIRCFLSNPDPIKCPTILENAWGAALETAPEEEGWNNCDRIFNDEDVQRFSTLAYRQYDQLFEQVPNARTYVAIKDNKLDIGIVDGDLGNFADARGVNYSKTFGMKNSELSRFYQYKGYDKMLNLDGGSSSQIWLNGRGPLHDWIGYPLVEDNQGPYLSRLVSSYLMLIPKKHTELITTYTTNNDNHILLDNSHISFNYDDTADHGADKAFVSLSPSLHLFTEPTDGDHGIIAGNFKIANQSQAQGAILFYMGEDTYYEDTEGLSPVYPRLRNLMVIGVGKIPNPMLDSLKNKPEYNGGTTFQTLLNTNNQAFYYIKMQDGVVVQYWFDTRNYNHYFSDSSNAWHSFLVTRYGAGFSTTSFIVKVDNAIPSDANVTSYSSSGTPYNMFATHSATHATIGAANIDGRFVTGNAQLEVDNYLFAIGRSATASFSTANINSIASSLQSSHALPAELASKYYNANTYVLQFEETSGSHCFSLAPIPEALRLYGLNLNVGNVTKNTSRSQSPTIKASVQLMPSEVLVYPNPTQNDLSIYLSQEEEKAEVIVRLLDINGRLIDQSFDRRYQLDKGNHEIRLNGLKQPGITSGIYLLSIANGKHVITKKIIIK